ncbi:GlxA family transcriptional regulator [Lichenicola cladoniae]|uniref:GlxA family transcriptional regulator n=1 Tax=Lichenicola cladoniae TaxID=1484109 RepID=A0A6M8HUH9_9PROT|nr:GlxA family transcriptional regulator [Lichenicola cladoniae]NPD66097.1 GlxA family transcriptional regulator [Acetobacteraceae bacterium]QKE91970.1 GlxA family transcriptional regulator [Lichenicola cladoniae]
MLKIGFIVTPGFPVMSLAALSVFEFANISAEKKLYDIQVLSEDGASIATVAGTGLETTAYGSEHFDTLIIGGNTRVVPSSPKLIAFIAGAAKNSRRISSICTGAFALADAGLLDDRRVTTHWLFTDELKSRFPKIRLEANRLFVVDGSVWTAAGNSAGIDLTLCMLENDYGYDLARSVARILVVDYRRSGGQPQLSALFQINPKSDRIQTALAHVRRNLQASLSVEDLARIAGLGPRQFSRAFRNETGLSPAKAIESIRIEAARLMIEQSRHSVDFIANETGFGDQERMRRAFLRVLGHPPQVVRRMAQVDPAAR